MPPTEILIIDDDPAVRDMLSLYLRSEGHAVRTAASGPEGIARCHEHPPSLVLCDLSMPGMSGLAVMSRLTADFPDLPVLVVSGTGDLGDAIEALKLGAWDFVTKPIEDLAVLDHAIGRAFERARLLAENRAYRIHLENTNARLETTLRRLEEDEEGGRRIQFALLPDARVDFRDITCTHFLVTSAILGGDFVDYFRIDDARFGFYMADVSGHGVPSAVVTVLLKGFVSRFLENHRHYGDPTLLDPAALLAALNPLVLDGKHGKYLTMFYAVVDLDANTLSFANGGHFPLPLISDGGEVRELGGRSRPVGLFRDAQFNTETLTLPDRFALRLYSDGVLELLDGPGNDARRATLRSVSRPLELDARNLAARLGMESNRPLPDDASILSIRRHAPHD